jgi:hypothetical protein
VSPGASEQSWIVMIRADATFKAVEEELKRIGFTVVRVFDELGMMEVRGSETLAAKAKTSPGVARIEKSETIDIGPPGALNS